ncbi:MAG TPA: efflux RND transporter permease subunit [Vicinamibacteria bacterium]|nr:efflux RND transporter permease subunit [Vicinamibacteria bacterium]
MTRGENGLGAAGKVARAFIDSKLTPLFLIASVALGLFTLWQLPREEEPQIIVPMFDVFVEMPGASPREIEERVTGPLEKLLWEVPGVEYLYSTSSPGSSLIVVRFLVGANEEDAAVRLNNKLSSHADRLPPGASPPLVKPRSIDDVPVLALTLWSRRYDHLTLRQAAAELAEAVKQVPDVSEVTLIGGARRQLQVFLDPDALEARGLSPTTVADRLGGANRKLPAGRLTANNRELILSTGQWLTDAEEVGRIVVGAHRGRPVFLEHVARIEDAGEEPTQYVFFGDKAEGGEWPAVTIAVAKRKGVNAVALNHRIMERVRSLKGRLVPEDVTITVTRDYGETAAEKSNELLFHMAIAVVSVALLIAWTLGRREAVIVLLAIPATLALTLSVFYFYGFTLNRITLFALIFSIGILVDDAIVVVENVARHRRLPGNRGRSMAEVAVEAVDEVGNPTILATLTVIAAILPMAFVSGLMGPYMRPIPIGASAAMVFSLIVAFVVTPWATVRLMGGSGVHGEHQAEGSSTRLYRIAMGKLIRSRTHRRFFLATVVVMLLGSMGLVAVGIVEVKMLPFDNKSELQLVIDMPEGTTLEETLAAARHFVDVVRQQEEVTHYQIYAGTSGPYTFNGLVRHYFLRRGSNVADVQVNLVPKGERKDASHEIAKRLRESLQESAGMLGARLKVVEVPPGPPVLQTLVAEIYGPDYERQIELAESVRERMEVLPGVVDVDWYVEDEQPEFRLRVDQEKTALAGVRLDTVARAVRLATAGESVGLLHDERSQEDVPLMLRLDRATRSDLDELLSLRVRSESGAIVPVGELATVERVTADRSIYHKNLLPVVYVTADVAGAIESPVYAILKLAPEIRAIELPEGYALEQYTASVPLESQTYSMKWDGEWHITYEVFRDLGLAFAAVLVLIYILVVAWFQSFSVPVVIMSAIPFSLVGILPAHGMGGAFFTATSMIGFIAGAGIVVRNSIILVDFVELRLREGMPLPEAVIDAGAVRFRPMLLTAAAVVVAAAVILFDPIFQGLAISLMAGEVASLLLSRATVPVAYFLLKTKEHVP